MPFASAPFAGPTRKFYPRFAKTATAGVPGSFAPPGSMAPANLGVLVESEPVKVTASPATLWTVGQRVVLRDGSEAYWDGSAWKVGRAPA